MKRLYILAGANGSGKSTISKVLLPSEQLVYVNPDDIANGGADFMLVAHGNGAVNVVAKERYEAFVEDICRK